MRKIDIHTHILPEHIPDWHSKYGYGSFIHLQHHKPCCARMIQGDKFFREIEHNCWDTTVRIKEMDDTAVTMQVLSTIPVLFNYWAKPQHGLDTSRFFNDHIAQCVSLQPSRFVGLGTVPLQDVDAAIQEMERCITVLKMPGIQIGSNVNNINLGEPQFEPFWQRAEQLNCSIFIHPWQMMGEEHMAKYWLPWLVGMPAETTRAICSLIFSGVLARYPKLKIALAHGGGNFAFTIGRIEHGFNVRPDLVAIDNPINPREYLGKFWIDSLVHDAPALDYLMATIGSNKICCGSDYPFPLGELNPPGKLIEEHIHNQQIKEAMLWHNAWAWLA
jgi:aminocarboxymuconate-semialdehyde decarboxylase